MILHVGCVEKVFKMVLSSYFKSIGLAVLVTALVLIIQPSCIRHEGLESQTFSNNSAGNSSGAHFPEESYHLEDGSEEYGRLYFNENYVAVLAQVSFQVEELESGVAVTVPYDDYVSSALSTQRPYVAFSKHGERLPVSDPRLGISEIKDRDDTFVIRFESAQIEDDGANVVFRGMLPSPSDLRQVYYATGLISGEAGETGKSNA